MARGLEWVDWSDWHHLPSLDAGVGQCQPLVPHDGKREGILEKREAFYFHKEGAAQTVEGHHPYHLGAV